MNWDFFAAHAAIGRKWGWWSAIPITVFWILLWPIGLVWFTASFVKWYTALDKSLEARATRRATRFLSWYPESWQIRHGKEFSDSVEEAMREGHGGPALTMNVVRESGLARSKSQPNSTGVLFWALCWLPLVGQGLIPMILKLTGVHVKALFLAFYLSGSYQWPFIIVMILVGSGLLIAALQNTITTRARE